MSKEILIPETKEKVFQVEVVKKLLTSNTETVPSNEAEIMGLHGEAVGLTLDQFLGFLPSIVRKKVDEGLGKEKLKLEILEQYFNDGSDPFVRGYRDDKYHNPLMQRLSELVNLRGTLSCTKRSIAEDSDKREYTLQNNEGIKTFSNLHTLKCNEISIRTLNDEIKGVYIDDLITEVKFNQVVALEDRASPISTEARYLHSHYSYIKIVEINNQVVVYVVTGDAGEKIDRNAPISKDNVSDDLVVLAYVYDKINLETDKNGRIVIPPYNSGVQNASLIKIFDNNKQNPAFSPQQNFDNSHTRLLPNVETINRNYGSVVSKVEGETLIINSNLDTRQKRYQELLDSHDRIKKRLESFDGENKDMMQEMLETVEYTRGSINTLNENLKNGIISKETYDHHIKKSQNIMDTYKERIKLFNPNEAQQALQKFKFEIDLRKIGLELQRLQQAKNIDQIESVSPSVEAIQNYRKEIWEQLKIPLSLTRNVLLPSALSIIGGVAVETSANIAADKFNPVTVSFEREYTNPRTGKVQVIHGTKEKLRDFNYDKASIYTLISLLALSSPLAIQAFKNKKIVDAEIKRVSGLKTPKI